MASHPPIYIDLRNKDMWQLFHRLGNEMYINNAGKELFPQLGYTVSGLKRGGEYKFVLVLEIMDSFEYKWNKELKKYERNGDKNIGESVSREVHTDIESGGFWEDNGVGFFEDVNLQNVGDPAKKRNATKVKVPTKKTLRWENKQENKLHREQICVTLNCKYIPVLAIYEVANGLCIQRGSFRFDETSFIVVSGYRNSVVRDQKSALNKSVGEKTKAKAQKNLKEINGAASGPDSAYSSGSDATPPPAASQYFGANGSLPSTSSSY